MIYTGYLQNNVTAPKIGDNLLVYRNEIKYYISYTEYEILKKLLLEFCQKDAFMQNPDGYLIKSLYFDSVYDDDYWSKINGELNRKKIRIRIYNNDPSFVKFEIKNRFANYNLKESLVINKNEAVRIIDGDFDTLNKIDSAISRKAATIMKKGLYSPKAVVQYEREAYTLPMFDIRITFDKNVCASNSSHLFFDDLPMIPVLESNEMILEVKYNHVLPQFLKSILSICDSSPTSISKYCFAREYLNNI